MEINERNKTLSISHFLTEPKARKFTLKLKSWETFQSRARHREISGNRRAVVDEAGRWSNQHFRM